MESRAHCDSNNQQFYVIYWIRDWLWRYMYILFENSNRNVVFLFFFIFSLAFCVNNENNIDFERHISYIYTSFCWTHQIAQHFRANISCVSSDSIWWLFTGDIGVQRQNDENRWNSTFWTFERLASEKRQFC